MTQTSCSNEYQNPSFTHLLVNDVALAGRVWMAVMREGEFSIWDKLGGDFVIWFPECDVVSLEADEVTGPSADVGHDVVHFGD